MIGARSSANFIKAEVMKNANGLGQSKTEARANSDVKGQNGHDISTKAHSISSIENLRTVTNQYIDFVKENCDGKVAGNIDNESVKAFIDSKAQEVAGSTLNTYISALAKMSDNLNQLGVNTISREAITDYRNDLKENGVDLKSEHINRAYEDPSNIVNNMEINTPYGLSATLQQEAGLRVDDALNSSKWTLNADNSLHIEGSKGGINYDTKILSDETAERVREAIENGYKVPYDEYREALKENVTGEDYNGTHGLRYNFAQERVEELKEQSYTHSEALSQTSLEMGHSREEITEHYLKH